MGGRPAKSANIIKSNISNEELEERKELEKKLKGKSDKIRPPTFLSKEAKKIFKTIVKELKDSEILSNLDIHTLAFCSLAIEKIILAEEKLEEDILDKQARIVQSTYMNQYFRFMNELCLSPQSRAKMANLLKNKKDEEEDLLLKALKE